MVPIGAVQLGLIVAIVIGCVALWNYIFALRSAGHPAVLYEPRVPVPWGPRDVVIVAVSTIAIVGLCARLAVVSMPGRDDSEAVAVHESAEVATPAATEKSSESSTADAEADSDKAESKTSRTFTLIVAGACGTALALAVGVAWLRSRGANLLDLGIDCSQLPRDFRLGFAGFVAASIPIYLIQWTASHFIPAEHPVTDVLQSHPGPLMLLATALTAVIVAPVTEEFFFRVVLQGWLEARFAERGVDHSADKPAPATELEKNPDAARPVLFTEIAAPPAAETYARALVSAPEPSAMPIVLSSFIFAIVHLEYGPSAVPLFFFALVLGYLYRQTHRIWPSIVTHASLNAFSTFIMVTSAS